MNDSQPEDARPPDSGGREISDLVGVELTFALIGWFLLVLAAFLWIGPVVGVLAVIAGVIGFGWVFASTIRRADITD